MMKIFIGYDSKEPAAFHVAMHSLMLRASRPVSIHPLIQSQLRAAKLYTRERGSTESTEFSLTRFLVPHLSKYEGYSLFLDSDVLVQADAWELMLHALANPDKAVFVAQHDYEPQADTKFLGQPQATYPRKNWSSVMLFNNRLCQALTPEYVNTATGLQLHRFQWLEDEQIGSLPLEWNWLVGEYAMNCNAKILHYTLGGPWFEATRNCEHADVWRDELDAMRGALLVEA